MVKAPKYTAAFKAEVIKSLLFNIAVTAEFSSRYGVPPVQVRRWIRETVSHLDELFEDAEQSAAVRSIQGLPRLSAGELNALLHNYDQANAMEQGMTSFQA